MLIIFTVNDQKVTHNLGQRTLVAGSSGVVKAAFTFDSSWDGLDIVAVFSNSGKRCNSKPVKYIGEPIDVPPEVLIAGKLYVSVIGFGDSGFRKTTQKWDVQQAISVHQCGALGGLDILRNMAQGSVPEENVATDEEVKQMLTDVFGSEEAPDEPDEETPVADVLSEILSKRLQPGNPTQPSISGFNLSGAKAVEAGTTLAQASYTAGTLNKGSYQYGPDDTGVVASNWVVQRITDGGTEQIASEDAASLSAGSDNNGGAGFQIGDVGGEGVVSSLRYKAIVTHGAGVTAKDNLGDDSSPAVSIAAGTKEKTTSAYTPFRNYFYGATAEKPALDSAYIRGLTKSGKAYAAGTITINVAAGTQRVCIACIGNKTGVTKVVNETAMNADVTDTFKQSTVNVEGAEGYTAQEYKVWVFEPAVPYENAATLKVTLG